jgi:hypothetical protein
MVGARVGYEVVAGGPWLSIVVFDRTGACVETLTIDTMQVVSVGTRFVGDEPGAARITTTAGLYVLPDGSSVVSLWVIAARRGLSHPDLLDGRDMAEVQEVLGE